MIKTVGVVGAGTMGSALAQKFAQEGFSVIMADKEQQFVERGYSNIKNVLSEAIGKKIFSETQAEQILSRLKTTVDLKDLAQCDLVLEAVFENLEVKRELFRNLSSVVRDDCILATNTSSFSIKEIAGAVKNPERFIGMHYFYHAAKNRLVEIIPFEKTSEDTYKKMKVFSVLSGKDAITTKDTYGFAVNRFFVPWLNESVRLLEDGIGKIEDIDSICMKLFGIGMGPFALMNATGVPIAYHAQKTLERFGSFYEVAPLLKSQAESGKPWDIGDMADVKVNPDNEKEISERMLGVVFYVVSQILDEQVCNASELNRGARIGLAWRKGPVDLMNIYKEDEVRRLVNMISDKYNSSKPKSIGKASWKMEYVTINKVGKNAVITMARPEDMNALNEEVVRQLNEKFDEADSDNKIETIFITGQGKAFVAGADIKFFIKNMKAETYENIVGFTKFGHEVYDKIDNSKKKIVMILNGITLGGGLELALCADVLLATPKATLAFPETGIGIYPGLGGTQRTVRKVGKGMAKYLIYTGKTFSAKEAEQAGLVDAVIQPSEVYDILEGRKEIPQAKGSVIIFGPEHTSIAEFFEKNTLNQIIEGKYSTGNLPEESALKIVKTIKFKAPIALQKSEKLIDEAKGCDSELDELVNIFSTSDAMLGLSNIGQKVHYEGK